MFGCGGGRWRVRRISQNKGWREDGGWPPVLNKHDPPPTHKMLIKVYYLWPSVRPTRNMWFSTFQLNFLYKKTNFQVTEEKKPIIHWVWSTAKLMQIVPTIWYWRWNWKSVILLFSPLLPLWEQIWIWNWSAKTNICLAHFPILFCQPTLLQHISTSY